MRYLHEYITQFREEGTDTRVALAAQLQTTKDAYNVLQKRNPVKAFGAFVDCYNWLGNRQNKATYQITENLARNLPGALMQDYLIHLVIHLSRPYPQLHVFTEQKVSFGKYPLWHDGQVRYASPAERSDIALGNLLKNGTPFVSEEPWPREAITSLAEGDQVVPIVTVNSKIRVSQSEFFDWLGREELMTKGNPHCLSIQVALRKEMDLSIVDAAQASHKWFLLGTGGETNVIPNQAELDRLIESVSEHLSDHMGPSTQGHFHERH